MTRKELFKQLNCLCSEMSECYDINSGGCCFVAAVLAEQLEKYKIPFRVAYCIGPTHYWIKVSDRNINRDGSKAERKCKWSSKFIYNLYYCQDWNPRYCKSWNLIVQTRITSLFYKYGNSIRRRSNNSRIRR